KGNKMVIVNPHANELKSKFPQKYEGNIIALPIRFGTEYFGPQIQDFFAGVKTLKIKLKTDVDSSIAFSSSHPIQSNSTLLDDKVTNTWDILNNTKVTGWHNIQSSTETEWLIRIFYSSPSEKDIVLGVMTNEERNIEFSVSYLNQTIESVTGKTKRVSEKESRYSSELITIPVVELFKS